MGRETVIDHEPGELQLQRYNHCQDWFIKTERQPQTPSKWFGQKFPYQQGKFGPPLLERIKTNHEGKTIVVPLNINEDFFAAILGGQRELKHQVVFFEPEQTWHFLDQRTKNFTPTTDQKLQIVLSQYFIQCAEQMPKNVDIEPLFVEFRSDDSLRRIVKRARSLLAADETFFSPSSPHERANGPETHERLARAFIDQTIRPEPQRILTVRSFFEMFCAFCRASGIEPLDRRNFTPMAADLIRERFSLNVRNDVLGENQRFQRGWKGLSALMPENRSR